MANREPTDEEMQVWRASGRFVCNCRSPRRVHIPLFDAYECRSCHRLVIPGGEELLRRYIKDTP